MNQIPVIFAWSGGKDSSFALWKTMNNPKFKVVALMTTYNKDLHRVSMHGNKIELTRLQAKSIGLPLIEMTVSEETNEEYEKNMEAVLQNFKKEHVIKGVVFGDIFLEDLRKYREDNLAKVNLAGFFPIWNLNTTQLAQDFIKNGFKTIICCCADGYLNENHIGTFFNQKFIEELPSEVDPCGENGEFHTFCFDGPIFQFPIDIKATEKIYKPLNQKFWTEDNPTKGFWYVELDLK